MTSTGDCMELNVNGARTFCYPGGKTFDAAKPTVVFLHGVLNDHSVWILQTRWFAHHGWNVLAVGLPGHCPSGGGVGLERGARAPARVTHLALVGIANPMKVSPALLENSLHAPMKAISM